MKVQCKSCGKRFSGEQASLTAAGVCPKCKARGDWFRPLEAALPPAAQAAAELERKETSRSTESDPLLYAADPDSPHPAVDVPGRHETPEDEITYLRVELSAMQRRVDRLNRRLDAAQIPMTPERGPVTNKLVWSNDIVLLVLVLLALWKAQAATDHIKDLQPKVQALIEWTEQDFLVR